MEISFLCVLSFTSWHFCYSLCSRVSRHFPYLRGLHFKGSKWWLPCCQILKIDHHSIGGLERSPDLPSNLLGKYVKRDHIEILSGGMENWMDFLGISLMAMQLKIWKKRWNILLEPIIKVHINSNYILFQPGFFFFCKLPGWKQNVQTE